MSTEYFPAPPSGDPAEYAYLELQQVGKALSESQPFSFIQALHVEPDKPREGMIVLADGTDWNPSDGQGPYIYVGGIWFPMFGAGVGGGAPVNADYVTMSLNGSLSAERVLTAGSGITITDGGANSTVTIAASGGSGAPVDATYVTLSLNGTLDHERVLTAGDGILLTDTGANGTITVATDPMAFTLGRTIEYASFGGNGGNMGGFGGPHFNAGFGGYSAVTGQAYANVGGATWEKLSRTQFNSSTDWGVTWASNWTPFLFDRQPFSLSAFIHTRNIGSAADNQWVVGFAGDAAYAGGSPAEAAYTHFFGFRMPTSGVSTKFQRANRVSSSTTLVDTGITVPTTSNAFRLSILVASNVATFKIDELQSDLSFSNVYSSTLATSALGPGPWWPTVSGPASTSNNTDIYIIRGIYTV